jgi:uncharacterized protein (DUF885 family)
MIVFRGNVPGWLLAGLAAITFGFSPSVLAAGDEAHSSDPLVQFSEDFWQWRARYQPFSQDDIPRLERPATDAAHPRDWSAAAVARQKAALDGFEQRWSRMDTAGWTVRQRVDYRLMGSALARVRWELEVNPRWQRDPTFYVDQTMTALLEALVQPPPVDAIRSRMIVNRMREIPGILDAAKQNLHAVRPFAQLAIDELEQIRPNLERVEVEVAPLLHAANRQQDMTGELRTATADAIAALESYRAWLQRQLSALPDNSSVGRERYEFFLHRVALLPYSPEDLVAISRREWDRAVAFEEFEKHRNRGVAELPLAASLAEELERAKREELAIRNFLEAKDILTVPAGMGHYTLRPMPGYLDALAAFGELDDFTGPSRLGDDGVRWVVAPSPKLGYFWLATAKDPRPDMVHEGVPGHYFQMCTSWLQGDPIRRHYYDSGANEGIGFYSEEMMLEAGLFDDSPRSREIIYNFMRLRALRVEVDVRLALGTFTMAEAADYLAQHVPMDTKTASGEAALFATTPGQAISYQIGKSQILHFLADAKGAQGGKFSLRDFHDFLWRNGNVPIALQRWEFLGDDREVRLMDAQTAKKAD